MRDSSMQRPDVWTKLYEIEMLPGEHELEPFLERLDGDDRWVGYAADKQTGKVVSRVVPRDE